jgi:hypothetical protein
MPRVGFEPKIPAFERTKTFHALDHTATLISEQFTSSFQILMNGLEKMYYYGHETRTNYYSCYIDDRSLRNCRAYAYLPYEML